MALKSWASSVTRGRRLSCQGRFDRRYAAHDRIPAERIHLYVPEDPDQSRGWPWAHTAIRRMGMLGGYEEAALVAARAGAAKMSSSSSARAGTVTAPARTKKASCRTRSPATSRCCRRVSSSRSSIPAIRTARCRFYVVLRGAAAGLGVSYNGLANDLEG